MTNLLLILNKGSLQCILVMLLLLVGCSEDENPVAYTTSNEIDVDWILVRNPAFQVGYMSELPPAVGYYFFYTNTSSIIANGNLASSPGLPAMEFIAIIEGSSYLSFTYNGEDFIYNIDDFEGIEYLNANDYSTRIIYNQDMNYLTMIDNVWIMMGGLDLSEPIEVIDYR